MSLEVKFGLILIIGVFYLNYAICVMSGVFWKDTDKALRTNIRKFRKFNNRLNILIAITTLFLNFFGIVDDVFIVLLLSVCLTLGEAIQNKYELDAEELNEKATEDLNKLKKEDNHLINAERIIEYCQVQIYSLSNKANEHYTPSPDKQRLVYEKMKDYLRYYQYADKFFGIYEDYTKGSKTLKDVEDELYNLQDYLKDWATELVKIPE